ncbi:hypothetical protein [Rhizobium tubonense]|uniref:Uncharacterized protein n=1 Tax=Rhizobium tubonense TaxID=484088 RepID=A0A2W4CVZ5_9HYPH|nr:hypothetical protein [Rhizobium tubonense]PZM16449.1 hypothetical protein CPY51_03680 [Rhizobium tubonense]
MPGAHFDYVEADASGRRVGKIQALARKSGGSYRRGDAIPLESLVVASALIGAANPSIVERNISSLARPIDPSLFAACAPFTLR